MKFFGGIYFDQRGLSTSIRGMHMQTSQINNIAQNITGFDKPGYQRIENVVSSFSEYIGVHGLSTVVDADNIMFISNGKILLIIFFAMAILP